MYAQINKQKVKTTALVASYLVLSVTLYVVCAMWSSLNPEESRTLALLSSRPLGPLFVMETGDMVSILPSYIVNAVCIHYLVRSNKQM